LAEKSKQYYVDVNKDFGAKGDGITDDTQAIKNAIASGTFLMFPSTRYKVTDELVFKHGQTILAPNGLIFDGTNFIGANGSNVMRVTNNGNPYTVLPNLTGDVAQYSQTLTFTSAHGLSIGDIICLYDNTPNSWSSARSYYKKGEYCKVAQVINATQILIANPTFDSYSVNGNANFGVYKMTMGTFNVIGTLEVIQGKQGSFSGVTLERVMDSVIKINVKALNGSIKAIDLSQCYNVQLETVSFQEKLSGLGLDYALSITNCQHIKANGHFLASRHGITHGGNDGIGCIVCRDIKTSGTVKTNGTGLESAWDTHGNVEGISFDGVIVGGANIGGSNVKIKGEILSRANGICVYFSEVKAFNHDLSGVKMTSYANPDAVTRGIVDFGGNSTAECNNMLGGTLNLKNVLIEGKISNMGIKIRLRNTTYDATQNMDVDLSGAKILVNPTGSSNGTYLNNVNTQSFRSVNVTNALTQSVGNVVATTSKQIGTFTTL
jgi:hypothetical protein